MKVSNKLYVLTLLLVSFLLAGCNNSTSKDIVESGHAVLINYSFDEEYLLLNGDWYFWEGELVAPDKVASQIDEGYMRFMAVPGAWKRLAPFEPTSNLLRAGTLALHVTLPPGLRHLSLRIPNISTAVKVYANAKLISETGRVSLQKDGYVPRNVPSIAHFTVDTNELYLVFQIVNHVSSVTGVWDYPALGSAKAVRKEHVAAVVFACLISGALLFMGLYHLALFLLRPAESSTFYFALICLLQAIRNLMMDEKIFTHLFPHNPFGWESALVVEHLSVHLTIPLFYLFFKRLFPKQIPIVVVRVVIAVSVFWSLFAIFTPALIYQRFLGWFEYFILASVLYIIAMIVRALLAKVQGAAITLVGLGVLLATGINDVLYSAGLIQTVFLSSFGVFVYLFIQAFYLSMSFAKLFNMVSKYSAELQVLNKSFERFIPREVLKLLNKSSIVDIELGDYIEKNMTVFFLDIRDFTSLSESMGPNDTFRFINSFLNRFGPIIRENGGFIDKYIGDGIMALFPNAPDTALRAAIQIRRNLIEHNELRLKLGWVPIKIGIGIHTGALMLGTIGENQRMDSTVISDTVNTASRLEDLTKQMEADIIVSAECIALLEKSEEFHYHSIGKHQVRGKSHLIDMYAIDLADAAAS